MESDCPFKARPFAVNTLSTFSSLNFGGVHALYVKYSCQPCGECYVPAPTRIGLMKTEICVLENIGSEKRGFLKTM